MQKNRTLMSMVIVCFSLTFLSFRTKTKQQHFDFTTYWAHYNNCRLEYQVNKDYKSAILEYKWMAKNGNDYFPDANDFIYEAICYAKLGDTTTATSCLRKAVIKGSINIDDYQWAKIEIGTKPFQIIKKELPDLLVKYYSSIPERIPMLLEEQQVFSIDQFVRSQHLMNRISSKDFDTLIDYADSLNVAEYIQNLKLGKIGPESWMLYHLYGTNDKYVPYIDSLMLIDLYCGKTSPDAYAFWIDRQRVYVENKPQKYGTCFDDFSPILQGDILNIDSIDFFRHEIGLPPLWQSAKISGFELPAKYKH